MIVKGDVVIFAPGSHIIGINTSSALPRRHADEVFEIVAPGLSDMQCFIGDEGVSNVAIDTVNLTTVVRVNTVSSPEETIVLILSFVPPDPLFLEGFLHHPAPPLTR
jgi:hypothetical protein